MTNARAAMDAHWERWLDEHLHPYHYPTMVQLADHLEIGHEMDHDMAYKSDRDALVSLHRIAHGRGDDRC